MSDFNATNPVVVGDATKKSDYDRAFDNTLALRQAAGHPAGGDWTFQQINNVFTEIAGHVEVELDGDVLSAVEVHCMAAVDGGTGQIQLFNVTTAGAIGSPVNVTATTAALTKITGLTLTAGVNTYRVEAKRGTTWITVWGARILSA